MRDKHIIFLVYGLLLIILGCLAHSSTIEPYVNEHNKIIFLGDYIFNKEFVDIFKYDIYNTNYGKYSNLNTYNFSNNCETLDTINNSFDKRLNSNNLNLSDINNEKTHIFISIGTNDVINNLYKCIPCPGTNIIPRNNKDRDSWLNQIKNIKEKAFGHLKDVEDPSRCLCLEEIKDLWKEKMNILLGKFPKANITIIDCHAIPNKIINRDWNSLSQFSLESSDNGVLPASCDNTGEDIELDNYFYKNIEELNSFINEYCIDKQGEIDTPNNKLLLIKLSQGTANNENNMNKQKLMGNNAKKILASNIKMHVKATS